MSLILNIDTALSLASVSLAADGRLLASRAHDNQKNHAEFLQLAVQELCSDAGCTLKELDAVAVTSGPGSYTGLRVGMASARGFCYALNKPFITVGTLPLLAHAAREQEKSTALSCTHICPMIDARRMEVFTALYQNDLTEILAPHARILDEHSFEDQLANGAILFTGDGMHKWSRICNNPSAIYVHVTGLASSLCTLSEAAFRHQRFTDLVLSEPFYVKDFYSPAQ